MKPRVARDVSTASLTGARSPRRFAPLLIALLWHAGTARAVANAQAGDEFLKLVDRKAYGESWDMASDYFKRGVSRGEWIALMRQWREPLGTAQVRTLRDQRLDHDPNGAPKGDYLLLTYETTFANGQLAKTETLPMVLGADGQWRAVGYFIR